jgi:hypothetical protein
VGDTTVRAGAIASLAWGVRALRTPIAPTQVITLTNHAASMRRYRLAPRFRMAEDVGRGLDLAIAPAELELAAGASGQVTVTAVVSPALLPPWELTGGAGVGDLEALGDAELDGWVDVTAIDAATGALADPSGSGRPLVVPFHLLARRASDIAAEGSLPQPGSAAPTRIELTNPGAFGGPAEDFTLLATDPTEPEIPPKIDLDAVGLRTRLDREGQTVVEFLLHSRGARMHPLETESLIELDTDRDGGVDYRVYTVDEELLRTSTFKNGKVVVALASRTGDLIGVPTARFYAGVDLNSRYTILPIVIDDTGLTAGTLAFNFRVQARDLVEQDLREPLFDQVPDRPAGGADRWLAFDGRAPAWRPDRASITVAGGGQATIRVQPGAAIGPGAGIGLALLFPLNEPAADQLLLRLQETFDLVLPALFR